MELVCLGVGAGKTMVYDGQPSSAFLLRATDSDSGSGGLLLIDCGLGVARACLQHAGHIPKLIYISHNHTDHAGELPVVVAVERSKPGGERRTVIAERRVARVLQERRLFETTAVGAFDADWIFLDEGHEMPIGHGLSIMAMGPCCHSELCFGFTLYQEATASHGRHALFSFTGDSGFSRPLFERLAQAPLVVADARLVATREHASFKELRDWWRARGHQGRLVIYHYGLPEDVPVLEDGDCLEVAKPGEVVGSWDAAGNPLPGHGAQSHAMKGEKRKHPAIDSE